MNNFQRMNKRDWQDILICIHKAMVLDKQGSKVMNKTIKSVWINDYSRIEEGVRNIIFSKFGDEHEKSLAKIHQITKSRLSKN